MSPLVERSRDHTSDEIRFLDRASPPETPAPAIPSILRDFPTSTWVRQTAA